MAEYILGFNAETGAAIRNIDGLKKEIARVTKEFNSAEAGSSEFIKSASNLSQLNSGLRTARSAVVDLDRAYKDLSNSIASFRSGMGARGAIPSLASPIQGSIDIAGSPEYIKAQAREYEQAYQDLLRAADTRARAIAEFRSGMAERGAISGVASPIRGGADIIGSPDFLEPLSLGRLENRLTRLKEEARRINPDSDKWRAINKEAIELERGIAKIQKRQRLGPTMGQRAGAAGGAFLYGGGLGGGIGSALGGIAGGLAGGVPGAFTGAALGQLSDNIGQVLGATASYTAEIDKQRIALKNVTKDVAEYQNALAFIDKTSRDLAIPQDVLNKQFTQLSASVIGAGGDINLAQEAFIGIAAGIRGTGGSLADMEGALRATAQVFSKGKVSAEELRQQIGERLPGAFTLFAKSMGKTPQELDKMLEQGQVTLNDFMGFVRTLSTEYGASASEIAASSQAAGDRLATTMSRMREAVGRELQPLGAQFQEIIANAVADNEENLVALAKAFSQAAQAIGSFIGKYGELIVSLGSAALLFGGTILAVNGISAAFAAIGPAIATASTAIAGYGGVMATLKLAIAGLGGPITLTIAGLVLLAKGVYDTNETFRNFVQNIGGILATDFKNAVDGMADDTRTAASEIESAFDTLKQNLQPIGNFIEKFFEDVFGSVSDDGESSASNVDNAFATAFDNILSQGAAAFSGLSALIGNWWNSLPAPIRNILAGNTASILVGAAGYAGDVASRASAPNAQTSGMFGKYIPGSSQVAIPASRETEKPRIFPGGGGGGADGGGSKKAKKGKELQEYIRNEQDFLRQMAQIGKNRIALTMGLSSEELSILQSQEQFRASNAINERQYLEDQRDAAKYSIETRDQYLKDIKEKYDNEKTLIQQQFDQSVYAPLLTLEKQLIGENEALEASLKALREGRTELTAEERIGLEVNRQLQAQAQAGLEITPEVTKAIQDQAKAQDDLNKKILYTTKLKALEKEVKLLSIINSEERRLAELRAENPLFTEGQIKKIIDLEKLEKNIKDARALIDGFVSQTSSDYKGFLKAVISGEDAADALKQFQEGLKDRVLTIFLDFAMAPVEKFLKESLEGLFLPKAKKEAEEPPKEATKDPVEATNNNTNATNANTTELKNLTTAIQGIAAGTNQSTNTASALPKGFGMSTSLGSAINAADYSSVFKEGSQALTASLTGVFADLSSALDASAYSLSESAVDYSDSFKDISDNAKDMAKKTGEAAEEAGENGEDMQEALGKTAAGIGIAAGAIMGIAAGLSQIKKGGTANVLGGIGSVLLSVGGAIGGIAKLSAANGAVWKGGFQAFANGGTVTGPTLGLVGEGKYNEAIVPLPDGRSIPVQMRGGSSRDLLNAPGSASAAPTMLSMSFQSTTINGVEYVDRAQLEAAMAETRKSAARDGASRGASLALDRLQNSPSTRRRVGIR